MEIIKASEIFTNSFSGFSRDNWKSNCPFVEISNGNIYLTPNHTKINEASNGIMRSSYVFHIKSGVLEKFLYKYSRLSVAGNNDKWILEKNSLEYARILSLIKRQKIQVEYHTSESRSNYLGGSITWDTTTTPPIVKMVEWDF